MPRRPTSLRRSTPSRGPDHRGPHQAVLRGRGRPDDIGRRGADLAGGQRPALVPGSSQTDDGRRRPERPARILVRAPCPNTSTSPTGAGGSPACTPRCAPTAARPQLRLVTFRAARTGSSPSIPSSPVPAERRATFRGLAYWPHDPALRFSAAPGDRSGGAGARPAAVGRWAGHALQPDRLGGLRRRGRRAAAGRLLAGRVRRRPLHPVPRRDLRRRDLRRRPLPVGLGQGRRPGLRRRRARARLQLRLPSVVRVRPALELPAGAAGELADRPDRGRRAAGPRARDRGRGRPTPRPPRHCLKCGRQIGPDESICEVCNRAGMATPSATQYHGTMAVAIIAGVAGMAIWASLAMRGVGPYQAEVLSVTAGPPDAAVVTFTVDEPGHHARLGQLPAGGARCERACRCAPRA